MSIRTSLILWRVLIGLSIISFVFVTWYKMTYSMSEATAYSVNTPEMSKSLLVLTQGSEFKDAVTEKVINYFRAKDVFIQVRDISSIPEMNMEDWNVIVVMHTWEISKPPLVVKELVDKGIEHSKFIFCTTSGNSESHIEGIDAITGASIAVNIDRMAKEIIENANQRFNAHSIIH